MSSTAKYHPLLSPISSPRPSHSPFSITPPRSPHNNVDVELEPFGGGEERPAPPPPLLRRHHNSHVHRFCRVFALVAAWGSMTVLAVALILYTSYKAMLILTGKGGGDGGQQGGGGGGGWAGGQYGGQHGGGGGP